MNERGPLHKTALCDLGKGDRSNRSLVTKGIKWNQQRYITKGHVPSNSHTLNNLPDGVVVKNVDDRLPVARRSSHISAYKEFPILGILLIVKVISCETQQLWLGLRVGFAGVVRTF